MFKYSRSSILALVVLCVFQLVQSANIRFINNIEGQSIIINTVEMGELTLDFQEVTPYSPISSSTVSVTSIMNVDGTGYSYTNTSVMVTLVEYTTVIASFLEDQFFLIMFNETAPSTMSNDITPANNAWVRFIDLTEVIPFVDVESSSGSLWTNVGYLEATEFIEIDITATTSFQAIQTGTSNTYPISLNFNLESGSVCTIFLFSSSTGPQGIVNLDRTIQAQATATATGSIQTTSAPKEPQHNSAAKTQIFGIGLFSIIVFSLFAF